jgi:cell division protein FtsQ
MGWRRKSSEQLDDAESAEGVGAPHVPDVTVLDELSRVFGDDGTSDGNPADDSAADGDPADDSAADGNTADDGTTDDGEAADSPPPSIISIGGDDELPDAVYLDTGDDVAGSGPVFIDDDGSSDAVMPKDATSHGIEPRLRQRRIGVRRAASRKRLWWAAVAFAVVVLVVGVLAVLGSSWFAVDEVSVSGNVYTDAAALDAVIDDLRGTPVLLVDTAEFEAALEEIAWVDAARVTTQFPNSARIEIRERTPVASMLGEDGRSRVLDADGRVLAVIEGQPVALVWISGPGTLDLGEGDMAPIGYRAASSLVTKLTPTIRSRLDSMLVTPDGSDLVLVLTSPSGPIEVRFGSAIGDNQQIEKLVRLERKLADIGDESVSAIDVSTAEVTVR